MKKIDLTSLTENELRIELKKLNESTFRGSQIFGSIHKGLKTEIIEMKGLSLELRKKLEKNYRVTKLNILKKLESKIDGTIKYLFELEDGNIIESVVMKYQYGVTICISTQVGCKMNCSFCATGIGGFIRDLSSGEIISQYYEITKDISEKITNIVLMGSGEPLDNTENLYTFLENITSTSGQNISYRNITISTCGIIPEIYKLADFDKPINLAISLHNPFDNERNNIMPIGKKYKINDIIESCRYYFNKTGRRISIEYTLVEGENTQKKYAYKLIELLKDLNCHINLIPLNKIAEFEKKTIKKETIDIFKKILEKGKLTVTVRKEMGSDIDAACGQLRANYLKKF